MESKTAIDLSKFLNASKQSGKPKIALGRGIGALIKDMDTSSNHSKEPHVGKVSLDKCIASPFQMRKEFKQEELEQLAQSILSHGVLQPILVKESNDQYIIIAGERRVRASRIAQLKEIPALILDIDDKMIMEIGVIENLQREDLNPIEEAQAFKSLIEEFNYTHEMVAKTIGKSRSYVTNYLQVLTLPKEIQDMLVDKSISMSHARMLAGMENPTELANKIAKEGLSVSSSYEIKQSDDTIKTKQKKQKSSTFVPTNPQLLYWLDSANIDNKLCNVKIKAKNDNSGTITISYKSIEELTKLLKI